MEAVSSTRHQIDTTSYIGSVTLQGGQNALRKVDQFIWPVETLAIS